MRKRPKRKAVAGPAEKLQTVVELVVQNAGETSYRLASLIKARFRCSRRCAQTHLARARAAIASELNETIGDLSGALQGWYKDALRRSRESDDLRNEVKILDSIRELCTATPDGNTTEAPVTKILFEVIDKPCLPTRSGG